MSVLNIPFIKYPYNISNPLCIKDFFKHNIHNKNDCENFMSKHKYKYKFIIRKPTYCKYKNIFCVSTMDKHYMFIYLNMKYYRIDNIKNLYLERIKNLYKKPFLIGNNIKELIAYILSIC